MSVIQLDNVTKQFADFSAVSNLSLKVSEGEVIGLLGHNGAGKTTTMKMILGLEKPTSGLVKVLGCDPQSKSFRDVKFDIGFLPENVAFYNQLTGREVLAYFAKLKRVDLKRVAGLLEKVGLSHAADRKVKTYSKGMKQRLGLCQAILLEPKLLLLDEPTVGLDPIATLEFYQIVDQLRAQGTTVLLCSHVLPGIERHIDRVVILSGGQLRAQGSLSELREDAGLPGVVRVSGLSDRDGFASHFPADTTLRRMNCSELEFDVTPENKMVLLNKIVNEASFSDIEVHSPTLEELYRYYLAHPSKPASEEVIS